MKKVIGVMIFFFLAMTFGGGLFAMIFSSICGGGVSETYLYPIYGGIVLLAGLIVICTVVILDEIKLIKDSLNKNEKADENKP
ncbi:MAG: hypothetical protein AAGU27_24350 [Dehalobacterium sp.]